MIGGMLTKVVSFLMLPLYTNWLSIEDFGTTDIISVYVSLLTGVVTLCVAEAIFIFPKDAPREEQSKYFSSALTFSILLFFILAILFHFVSKMLIFLGVDNSFIRYRWFIYGLICTTFAQTFTQQFACAINQMKIYSFTGLVYVVALALCSFIIIPEYKVEGYIYSMIFANVISVCYTFVFSGAINFFSFKYVDKLYYKRLIVYSVPLIPNALMWWLVSSFNRPLLESKVGLVALGIYAVGNKFPSLINVIVSYFSQSWQISVLEEYRKESFPYFYNGVLKLFFMLLLLIAVFISVFSNSIILLVSNDSYLGASQIIPVLLLGVVFSAISSFIGSIYAVYKNSKYFFYSSIFGAIAAVVLNYICIPLWGLYGASLASMGSFAVIAVVRIHLAAKYIRIVDFSFYIFMIISYVLCILSLDIVPHVLYSFLVFAVCSIACVICYSNNRRIFISLVSKIKIK